MSLLKGALTPNRCIRQSLSLTLSLFPVKYRVVRLHGSKTAIHNFPTAARPGLILQLRVARRDTGLVGATWRYIIYDVWLGRDRTAEMLELQQLLIQLATRLANTVWCRRHRPTRWRRDSVRRQKPNVTVIYAFSLTSDPRRDPKTHWAPHWRRLFRVCANSSASSQVNPMSFKSFRIMSCQFFVNE